MLEKKYANNSNGDNNRNEKTNLLLFEKVFKNFYFPGFLICTRNEVNKNYLLVRDNSLAYTMWVHARLRENAIF